MLARVAQGLRTLAPIEPVEVASNARMAMRSVAWLLSYAALGTISAAASPVCAPLTETLPDF
jgi:hypothetical protein